jgi:hypothetical protein
MKAAVPDTDVRGEASSVRSHAEDVPARPPQRFMRPRCAWTEERMLLQAVYVPLAA